MVEEGTLYMWKVLNVTMLQCYNVTMLQNAPLPPIFYRFLQNARFSPLFRPRRCASAIDHL